MIISFITLYKNAFFKKINLLEWKELNANEFNGVVKPFGKYDAVISYDIKVYFDSIKNKYTSKSVFKDKLSWIKSHAKSNISLLRHEQYHFNIAEYHSRLLNKRLEKLKPKNQIDYKYILDSVLNKNEEMQKLYDIETDHSLKENEQIIWEETIDSLLRIESNNQQYSYNFLNDNNYKIIWTNMSSNDSIVGKIELYISKQNDTIWNQYKIDKEELKHFKSRFYEFKVLKLKKSNNYQANIQIHHDFNNLKFTNINLEYLEQNKDSLWKTNILLKSLDSINVKFENYYNDKFHGIIRWTISDFDSIKKLETSYEHYLMIDNKVLVSDTFVEKFELSKIKNLSN
jgi:hypothetical protein